MQTGRGWNMWVYIAQCSFPVLQKLTKLELLQMVKQHYGNDLGLSHDEMESIQSSVDTVTLTVPRLTTRMYTYPNTSSHVNACLDNWEILGAISLLQSEYAWRGLHREARKAHITSSSPRGAEFLWGHHTAGGWHTVFSWTAKHALSKWRGMSKNVVSLAYGFFLKLFV